MEERSVAELLKELDSKDNLIESIYNLLEVITTTSDLTDIYDKILEIAIHTIKKANFGSLLVIDDDNMFNFACLYGFDKEKFKDVRLKPEETSLYRETSGLMDKTCIINEIFKYNHEFFESSVVSKIEIASEIDVKTTISVPIRFDQKVIAILNLDSTQAFAFDDSDKRNLELFAMETSNFIKIKHLMNVQEYINNHDDLTGVYNKRFSKQLVIDKIEKKEAFEMVVIDLDNLKAVNDNYGHIFGDYYIKEFAQAANRIVSKYGIFSRFGGDEFNIIVPTASLTIVDEVSAELRQLSKNNKLNIEYSYGIARYPEDGSNYDELFKVADTKMYVEKVRKKTSSS